MKKIISGLIIIGLGIGFPACLGIFLGEAQYSKDNTFDGTKPDNVPGEEKPGEEKPGDPIQANINVDPDALNFKSKGKWITVYISLSMGYDVNNIVLDSVLLNELIPAEPKSEILEFNNHLELMVKFNRASVKNVLPSLGFCTITITGELIDGKGFEGTDIIKLIHF
ncbi:MAG: hypothetical protein ACFFA7_06745 [Promethearchaeota archaeon]